MGLLDIICKKFDEKSRNDDYPYKGMGGKMIDVEKAKKWIEKFDRKKEKLREVFERKEVVHAEAFSLELLARIVSNSECVGIRVYYTDGDERENFLIVGIDKAGKDLVYNRTSLKGGDDSGVGGEGAPQPPYHG